MSWRGLACWAVLLLLLACAAGFQRQRALASVNRHCIEGMRPYAERELGVLGDYTWNYQGPAVYLVEHGKRDPQLLRLMLLNEARKSYDSEFLYSSSWNYDLRCWLIAECTAVYPHDPAVAWAAGRCLLTASSFDAAADELLRAEQLGFAESEIQHNNANFQGRLLTALLMADRDQDAFEWLSEHALTTRTEEAYLLWADQLCDCYQYDETLASCELGLREWPESVGLNLVWLRALWWNYRFDEFRAAVLAAQVRLGPVPELNWALARLALIDQDYERLEDYYPISSRGWARALADGYGLLGDQRCLMLLKSGVRQAVDDREAAIESQLNWWELSTFNQALSQLMDQRVRAHILRFDWAGARAELQQAPNDITISGDAITLANLYLNLVAGESASIEPSSNIQQYFPYLKFAPEFLAATAAGGHDPEETWLALREQLQQAEVTDWWSARGYYRDYSNGELDW